MSVIFDKSFNKKYFKADEKIRLAFKKRLKLFIQNPNNPLLNNHSLTGKYKGCRSINVTGDWRAIYREFIDENGNKLIFFCLLDTHSQFFK